MTNKEVADHFRLLGDLMELHSENPHKIRSYQQAYRLIRRLDKDVRTLSDAELRALPGVGNAIAAKIRELLDTGAMRALETYRQKTPDGVQQMLGISGFGPKKVAAVWKELDIESPGELLYACYENRLTTLKGFGEKTQAKLIASLQLFLQSQGKHRYAEVEPLVHDIQQVLRAAYPDANLQVVGAFRRQCPVIEKLEYMISVPPTDLPTLLQPLELTPAGGDERTARFLHRSKFPVSIHTVSPEAWQEELLKRTGSEAFVSAFYSRGENGRAASEEDYFQQHQYAWVHPALRESDRYLQQAAPSLIQVDDIAGILHAHSTYSDGQSSLREMALACRERGYSYLGITDHSRIAVYANGLSPERVHAQWKEIDQLNRELAPFRIFKGIEADILSNGDLDYDLPLLKGFDFVIASIHSHLSMEKDKAMHRLLTAIAHPCTRILGHPTGRLLLARSGYPIDHKVVIDACAKHDVIIELNANPYRLDLDWSWIPYAVSQGVRISINPDAHSIPGIDDVRYGVLAAQKGGLTADQCLTTATLAEMNAWMGKH